MLRESFEIDSGPAMPRDMFVENSPGPVMRRETFEKTGGFVGYGHGTESMFDLHDSPIVSQSSSIGYESSYFSAEGVLTGQDSMKPGCCPPWCQCGCLMARPLWRRIVYMLCFVLLCFCMYAYLTVPEILIAHRVAAGELDIRDTVITIGPFTTVDVSPHVRFSVSKSVLAFPAISYQATVHKFNADIFFWDTRNDDDEDNHEYDRNDLTHKVKLGKFSGHEVLSVNSAEDFDVTITGTMRLASSDNLASTVNELIRKPSVTIGIDACMNVYAKVYGWIPIPFFNVLTSKSITFNALDGFTARPIDQLDLVSMHGTPGQLHVVAKASVYNPSPVSVVLFDGFDMQVQYRVGATVYELGRLMVRGVLTLAPGDNMWTAELDVDMSENSQPGRRKFLTEYFGRSGELPAARDIGTQTKINLQSGFAGTTLMGKVTTGLDFGVSLPNAPQVLHAVTADISGVKGGGMKYEVTCHVQIINPLPQRVILLDMSLNVMWGATSYLINKYVIHYISSRSGEDHYSLGAHENKTLDFPFEDRDLNLYLVYSKGEFWKFMSNKLKKSLLVNVSLHFNFKIADGCVQPMHYENSAMNVELQFKR